MKIQHIEPTNFRAGIKIKSAENRHCKYLYNMVEAIRKECKIPVNFRTHEIELPSVSQKVIQKLKELNIRFQ